MAYQKAEIRAQLAGVEHVVIAVFEQPPVREIEFASRQGKKFNIRRRHIL
jgi:hypothetical protein